ncbi:MAG: toprim domain-containing protein [Candidatus Aenigmatarchaeota archaeon]
MDEIRKLSDYEHVRLRTEMYFGSRSRHTQEILLYDENFKPKIEECTWIPAIYTYFREIVDNSLDELLGYRAGDKLIINYNPQTFEFVVEDNGRGIPIDFMPGTSSHLPEVALTNLRAGRNFGERNGVVGANGIGAAATNFTSEYFRVTIHRDQKCYKQNFREGEPIFNELIIEKPSIKNTSRTSTGTRIEFKPSKFVFNEIILPDIFIKSRVIDIALSNPDLQIFFNGERIRFRENFEKELFEGFEPIVFRVEEQDFYSKFILVPNFTRENDFYHSVVNNIPVFNGGVHIDMFRKYFFSGLLNSLEKESKKRKLNPNRSDVSEGLLVFNITKMKSPVFDSQSKTRLINEEITSILKNYFSEKFFIDLIKKNKKWIDEIYERCSKRTSLKDHSELEKISRKLFRKKISKLIDATNNNRSECILFLTEGDSATSGLISARNPKYHASMPLRGKIMNVSGESVKTVLNNKELCDIMSAVGLKIGEKAIREKLRYGKVYIATDADPDGGNIACLLINFFYNYWPELFNKDEEPFIYIFLTPYIIAENGKIRKYWYNYNYDEFNPEEFKGWSITRAKGLGSLTREDWKYSLEKPEVIGLRDDGNLRTVLDLIFNESKSDERKLWISSSRILGSQ